MFVFPAPDLISPQRVALRVSIGGSFSRGPSRERFTHSCLVCLKKQSFPLCVTAAAARFPPLRSFPALTVPSTSAPFTAQPRAVQTAPLRHRSCVGLGHSALVTSSWRRSVASSQVCPPLDLCTFYALSFAPFPKTFFSPTLLFGVIYSRGFDGCVCAD